MSNLDPSAYSLIFFGVLTISQIIMYLIKDQARPRQNLTPAWIFIGIIALSEWVSFSIALWLLAFFSFYALREFFSLVDIRLEDRYGLLVSYLSIPFMFYLIQTDWYGLFIIAIPVYTYLLMPFFIALGKNSKGIVFSVGVLDFGLFFYVFCMGHIGYMIFFSVRMAMIMIVVASVADSIVRHIRIKNQAIKILLQITFVCPLLLLTSEWSGIPMQHAFILGTIIAPLSSIGFFSLRRLEKDLGIRSGRLQPGRGKTIEALKTYLYTAPVFFHYLRHFLDLGD